MKQCSVVVYGDLGRSPRMQNHVVELLEQGYKVNFLGYQESSLRESVLQHANINIIDLNLKVVNRLKKLPRQLYLLYALLRILLETLFLFSVLLFRLPRQEFILIQNPPSIPVMAVCYLVKVLRRSKFVVDFHNYGYTILGLQLRNKLILRLARAYEVYFGRKADFSFCVSKAMQTDLQKNWLVGSKTGLETPAILYDKANTSRFKPFTDIKEKHEFLEKLKIRWDGPIATQIEKGQIVDRASRPFMMVSSTSWTKDEDFGILLSALEAYELYALKEQNTPRIYMAITGKGPEKEYYSQIIQNRKWEYIKIELLWLEVEDYPRLLASCDMGVCLHYSSSGLDLPMKVVDMFGAGIPVLAKRYQAIPELVEEGKNGLLFNDSQDLFEMIIRVVKDFSDEQELLTKMKKEVLKFRQESFHDHWKKVVLPFLKNKAQ